MLDGVNSQVEVCWNGSRPPQPHWILVMPAWALLDLPAAPLAMALFAFAAVRSQCFLMKMGMSEKALKRWVLICALDDVSQMECNPLSSLFCSDFFFFFFFLFVSEFITHLESFIREIARML